MSPRKSNFAFVVAAGVASLVLYSVTRNILNGGPVTALLRLLATAAVAGAFYFSLRTLDWTVNQPRRLLLVVGTACLVSVLLRLLWIQNVDSLLFSDYNSYVQCALNYESWPSFEAKGDWWCQSELFQKRAYYYLIKVFQHIPLTRNSLEYWNLFLWATGTLFFVLACYYFESAAAVLPACIAYLLWPDSLYSLTLASPDISGINFFAIFLFAVLAFGSVDLNSKGKVATVIFGGLCLGLGLHVLDFSRSLAKFALFSILVVGLVDFLGAALEQKKRVFARWTILIVGAFSTASVVTQFFHEQHPEFMKSDSVHSFYLEDFAYMTAADTRGFDYAQMGKWARKQWPEIYFQHQDLNYALSKTLNVWTRSKSFRQLLFNKTEKFNNGVGYINQSRRHSKSRVPDALMQKELSQFEDLNFNNTAVKFQKIFSTSIYSLMILFLALRLFLVSAVKPSRFEIMCWSSCGLLYLAAIAVLDVQARYSYLLIFPCALSVGRIFAELQQKKLQGLCLNVSEFCRKNWKPGLLMGMFMLAMVASSVVAYRNYLNPMQSLHKMKSWSAEDVNRRFPELARGRKSMQWKVKSRSDYASFYAPERIVGDAVAAFGIQWRPDEIRDENRLRLMIAFLSSAYDAGQRRQFLGLDYALLANQEIIAKGPVGDKDTVFVSVPLKITGQTLELDLLLFSSSETTTSETWREIPVLQLEHVALD